jgi:hypothetical protein
MGGDRGRGPAHLGRADYAGMGVATRVADARVGLSGVARAEALDESGRAERGGRVFLAASCARAVDRGVDDGPRSHSFSFWRGRCHRTHRARIDTGHVTNSCRFCGEARRISSDRRRSLHNNYLAAPPSRITNGTTAGRRIEGPRTNAVSRFGVTATDAWPTALLGTSRLG